MPKAINLQKLHLHLSCLPLYVQVLIVGSLLFLLLLSAFFTAGSDSSNLDQLGELLRPGLLSPLLQTVVYIGGSLFFAMLIAGSLAVLFSQVRFIGQDFLRILCLLPFAVPVYLLAYTSTDFLSATAITNDRGLFLACALSALAVYPYIFILLSNSLLQQSCTLSYSARLQGADMFTRLRKISIPLALPALLIGALLAAVELFNDIGLAQHFGIKTLGVAIYTQWFNLYDLSAGAKLSVFSLVFVCLFLWAETNMSKRAKLYDVACKRCRSCDHRIVLGKKGSVLAWCFGILPPLGGFFLPVFWLGYLALGNEHATAHLQQDRGWATFVDTVYLMVAVGLLVLLFSIYLGSLSRMRRSTTFLRLMGRFASVCYVLPGVVLALAFLQLIDSLAPIYSLGWLFNSTALLIFACSLRFAMLGAEPVLHAFDNIPVSFDARAQVANISWPQRLQRIYLPQLVPGIGLAMVFVSLEVIKELPLNLLLSPSGFSTLAIEIYQHASDERLAQVSVHGLLLICIASVLLVAYYYLAQRRQVYWQ